jgi:hypothetical protein
MFLKYIAMSKEKELKEKHDKKAPQKNLKEKRAAKVAKRDEKKHSG